MSIEQIKDMLKEQKNTFCMFKCKFGKNGKAKLTGDATVNNEVYCIKCEEDMWLDTCEIEVEANFCEHCPLNKFIDYICV